jgi:RNA polymerase sigma-70 factor, ECF subfamily
MTMLDDRSERFLRLYEPHRDALWRFARSLVRSDHEAEDVVSETVLQALEGIHRLRDEQAFVSFLFTIASRYVKRHRWRQRIFGSYDADEVERREHPSPQPDIQADIQVLRQALQQLPARTREAIVMFEINGFSLEEIKKVQGGSLSGVKSRLARGRQQLARLLEVDTKSTPERSSTSASTKPIIQQQTVL